MNPSIILPRNFFRYWLIACGVLFLMAGASAAERERGRPMRRVDVTPNFEDEGVWTFTLESNTYRSKVLLSPTLDYSGYHGWDIQLASYNIPVYGGSESGDWDTYVNISKTFDFSDSFKGLLGTQNGIPLFNPPRHYHNFDYASVIWQPFEWLDLHGGPYFANAGLATTGNKVGFTAGFSLDIWQDDVSLQGSYFSGHASISGAIVNLLYMPVNWAQIYVGVGIPEQHTGNEYYGTLGFSLSTKGL